MAGCLLYALGILPTMSQPTSAVSEVASGRWQRVECSSPHSHTLLRAGTRLTRKPCRRTTLHYGYPALLGTLHCSQLYISTTLHCPQLSPRIPFVSPYVDMTRPTQAATTAASGWSTVDWTGLVGVYVMVMAEVRYSRCTCTAHAMLHMYPTTRPSLELCKTL